MTHPLYAIIIISICYSLYLLIVNNGLLCRTDNPLAISACCVYAIEVKMKC
uniref:Uncharacterized protein n=1 Tax=Anguilla anguilla TaxID=7936 RepID=A0A0E9V7J0_ANGAN